MKTAAVSKLKAQLSDYLNQVKAGAEILITDHGKPVARIVPLSRQKNVRESLAKIEKQGLIKLGSGKLPKDFWPCPSRGIPKDLSVQPSWKRGRKAGEILGFFGHHPALSQRTLI